MLWVTLLGSVIMFCGQIWFLARDSPHCSIYVVLVIVCQSLLKILRLSVTKCRSVTKGLGEWCILVKDGLEIVMHINGLGCTLKLMTYNVQPFSLSGMFYNRLLLNICLVWLICSLTSLGRYCSMRNTFGVLMFGVSILWVWADVIISEGLAINCRFSSVFRMEIGGMQVGISISGFLILHGAKITDRYTYLQTSTFHP